ncbi:MAG: T9SS type A sorting domain-containing protein, partial [Ignavibacteriales bacterium]|nr:T9SS type A sorting domain-containing protein [Ignavibacteriales bacterium]
MDIRSRVNEKVKNKDFGIDDFIPEYNAVIANLNGLMQRTSDASIIKTIIFRLSQCYQLMNKTNELKSFVDKLLGIKKMEDYSPYIKRHLMPYYIDQKDYSSALAIADEIIKVASSDEDLLCEMLYEKALIYKYSLNELERADAFFNEIVNKYPENIMTRFANSELGKKNSSERNVIKPNDEIVVSHKNDLDINNYPNPFNPTTTISFTLPSDGRVTIKVYDMLGREVKTLVNDFKSTGSYSIIWDSKDNYSNEVSSGIYFYNIKFKDNSVTKKMLLVR